MTKRMYNYTAPPQYVQKFHKFWYKLVHIFEHFLHCVKISVKFAVFAPKLKGLRFSALCKA